MKSKHSITLKDRKSFYNSWNQIIKKVNGINNDYWQNYLKDQNFFDEIPLCQDYLTLTQMIFPNQISFSNFIKIDPYRINMSKLNDCFCGILFYIYFNSNNKLNTKELEFHFNNAQYRQQLTTQSDDLDILNIFNYSSINTEFKVDCCRNAFFGVTFRQIKVMPIAYAIRSGNSNNHLVSFNFEAFDEDIQRWVVLDERVNLNNLIPIGGFSMFYVRSVDKSYSSFQIKQTEPSCNGFWGFSIAAFEIHGDIFMGDQKFIMNNNISEIKYEALDLFQPFNPIIDMTEYI